MWTYAPDLDERTSNILRAGSQNVVPTNNGGMRQMYVAGVGSLNQPAYPALAAVCVGSRYLLRQDGTDRMFAGAPTKLYEANQTVAYAWTDVSRGANYSGVDQWMFDAYGDTMLAAASQGTRTEIQASTGAVGTAFANLTNAPKARIIVVQSNIILAFDIDTGGGGIPDGWIGSDVGSSTNWTTGESVSGRFTETPGNITAAIKQGAGVVVFKDRGMWRGQYVGLPEVWRWELVTPSVGCVGPLAVVNIDDILFFADATGFWKFDGSRPQLLSTGLNNAWASAIAASGTPSFVEIGVDDRNSVLQIAYDKTAGNAAQSMFTYHYRTGAFGPNCALNYISDGTNNNAVEAFVNGPYNKIHLMPGLTGDSSKPNAYFFAATTHTLRCAFEYILNVQGSISCVIKPGLFGDSERGASVTRIYHLLRDYQASTTGTGTTSWTDTLSTYRRAYGATSQQASNTGTLNSTSGATDVRAAGHWFDESVTVLSTVPSGGSKTAGVRFEWMGFEPEYASPRPKN